ncbi:argonaute 2 isoform X2 [Lasioglossum baleicum]|uniref:argonaute 2 isoform X2 n=1 Tax=Lasioglossum baleicum TaxID=434251 RepID=UPI003FCD87F3
MGKKGKGKKKAQSEQVPSQQQQQQQQQQGPSGAQEKKTGGPQQQRGPPEAQQQQQGPSGAWQKKTGEPKQQQQQQRGPPEAQQQQQGPPGAWQQKPGGAQHQKQQQQRGPPEAQQQQGPPGAWQQRAPVPQQQQQRLPTPQQQQQGPPGAWQQGAPVPQQQQQGPPSARQQRPPVSQQQQQRPPGAWQQGAPVPQQQQQGPPSAWQQRPPTPQQQQQGPPGAWQQGAPMPQQQQQRLPTPQQQQQGPPGAWQQGAPVPQQQQQGPSSAWQQRPPVPQQAQQRPPTPQQQQQGPPGAWQQRPPVPQQAQQRPPVPQQAQQRPPTPQQQQQGPPGAWQQGAPVPQQQQQGPPGAWQQGAPVPQQQQQGPPGAWQQGAPVPQQQQQQGPPDAWQQRAPVPQQQRQGPSGKPGPQKQKPPSEPVRQQQWQMSTYCGGTGKLTDELTEMYLKQIPMRMKANGGTEGRPITVETNMFKINFNKFQPHISHYDVVIEPDKPKFLLRPAFEAYRKMCFPNRHPAFDGKKNAYSAKDLPFGAESPREEVSVYDNERQQQRTFKVYLKRVATLDLTWLKNVKCGFTDLLNEQRGLQALDIILRHGAASTSINVGRSLFQPPEGRVVPLSNGLDLWVGIFQSAVVGWKPYLNVDVAHKGFPTPQSIIDLLLDLCKSPRDQNPLQHITPRDVEYNKEKITKFLKGLKVQYEIPGQPNSKRTYRVNELVECPRRNRFALENGQMCTVEQYFAQQKNFRLKYPELPCLWVGSRTNQRRIHLPIELCTIVAGQVTQKKMDESQTTKMIRYAATSTDIRKQKIMNGFSKMKINEQPALVQEFKLSVSHDFEKVPARVLPAPKLKYESFKEVTVSKGQWRAEKFLKASSLADNEWTILNLDQQTRERDLHDGFQPQLRNIGRSINMNIGKAQTPFACFDLRRDLLAIQAYFKEKKKQNIKLVVAIIPGFDNAYSVVKQYSELKTPGGMVTQVIKGSTLRRLTSATVSNILLKINSKLNGVNHILSTNPRCLQSPCMLVGADVTHPSPDSTDTPSIAAVAASYNPSAFQYNIELRLQPPREEMIQDLEEIMVKQLLFFYKSSNQKPQKIIFYRDGVSEGQLTQVMHYEISAIKRAIAKMGSGEIKIPITFLVVQKRHHTRFFPTDLRNSDDKNKNVQAGTIVDTEITHPTQIDFYLVSHASIQGTARPTKYRCIANEIGLTEDEIEQLTYYLCHLFARCTRSVSYPAPTYYAHLAAFRARALIQGVRLDIDNLQDEQRTKMTLQMQNSPMFFV